jgi:hypothetical protein
MRGLIGDENSPPSQVNCPQLISIYQQLLSESDIYELVPILAGLFSKVLIDTANDLSFTILHQLREILDNMPRKTPWQIIKLGIPLFAKLAAAREIAHPLKPHSADEKSEMESIVSVDKTFSTHLMTHLIGLMGDLNITSESGENDNLADNLTTVFQPLLTTNLLTQPINHKNEKTYLPVLLTR